MANEIVVYAFCDLTVRIIWIERDGQIVQEQSVTLINHNEQRSICKDYHHERLTPEEHSAKHRVFP